jgi:putative aldouronate transport system substrate-binding protein
MMALAGGACQMLPAAPTPAPTSAANGRLTLPAYVPVQGPPPDLPGTDAGVRPAYFTFPTNLVQSVQQAPGKGGDVNSLFYVVSGTPPAPLEQNSAWQELNKQLNATLKVVFVSYADYPARLATILAGNDLPDMFCISVLGSLIQGMPDFMERSCADLTPYLAGDAIKQYPNLANLPSSAWLTAVFNDKLFCIPQVDSNTGPDLLGNGNQLAQLGANFSSFKSVDDFSRVAKELTDPGNHWAIGSNILTWMLQVFRVPNDWRESGGKLTKDIETEEYKEAVAYLRGLWDAGVIWPDTPAATVNTLAQGFYAGKYTFWPNVFLAYTNAWDGVTAQDANFDMHALIPFGHDGGQGVQFLGNGSVGLTVLKKASADRVQELLGILNYLAAPFGSPENLLIQYGLKDTDYAVNERGNPMATVKGQTDIVPWAGLVRRPPVLFDPHSDEAARRGYADETAAISIGIKSPTVGLYSNTYAQKGSSLNRTFTDGINQILYGRDPVSNLDQLVQDWRSNGGDQIRAEYEAALSAKA